MPIKNVLLICLGTLVFSSSFANYMLERVIDSQLSNKGMTVMKLEDRKDSNFCYILEDKNGNTNISCVEGIRRS